MSTSAKFIGRWEKSPENIDAQRRSAKRRPKLRCPRCGQMVAPGPHVKNCKGVPK